MVSKAVLTLLLMLALSSCALGLFEDDEDLIVQPFVPRRGVAPIENKVNIVEHEERFVTVEQRQPNSVSSQYIKRTTTRTIIVQWHTSTDGGV